MSSPRIYVDFDDVLCETARPLLRLAGEMFGVELAYDEIRWFDLRRSFRLDKGQLDALMERAHRPAFLEALPAIPGAAEVLAGWERDGLEVHVVTGRPPETDGVSRAWLRSHGMRHSCFVVVDKYGRIFRGGPVPDAVSLDQLAEMDFAAGIDDAPAMLDFLLERTSMPVIVYDRPWNAGKTRADRLIRCGGWREIDEKVRAIAARGG